MRVNKEVIKTDTAPQAIGPYSQAIRAGDLLFVSGQISIDLKTGKLLEGDIDAQTEQVLTNLRAILEAGGSSLDKVVKVTVFLQDMADFAAVNQVYGAHFSRNQPARSCVAVARLPKGARVEIEAIALVES